MAAILLGLEFDLPTVKIRTFSTNSKATDTAFWNGPIDRLPIQRTRYRAQSQVQRL